MAVMRHRDAGATCIRNQENSEKNSRPFRGHGPISRMGLIMLQHQ